MLIFIQELVLQLFLWLLQLIDGIMEIFSAISGVTKVTYHGEQVNLIELVVGDSTVGTIFWCVFILAVGLSCIFAIVGLVKNMVANNRTVSGVLGKFFLSLLGTMAMLTVVVLGILMANAVLQLVSNIFQISNTTKLSTALFNACVGDWINGYSAAEFDVGNLSVRDIFGDYKAALFGIWPTSWKCNGMVNPNTFLYFPSLVASIALGIAMIVAIINLAKRVFEIVFLYLVMPISMSTLAADDGARFKIWRETFITKIVLAYGAIFSVNIFVLILPLLSQMKIDGIGGFGNSLFLIFMIIGGAMVIPAGMNLFARLFGQADDAHGGGTFLRSAYYGSRFAGLATLGLAGGILRTGYRGARGAVRKIRAKKSADGSDGGNSNTGGDGGNNGDGGDRYTETPAAAENTETDNGNGNTATGGSE